MQDASGGNVGLFMGAERLFRRSLREHAELPVEKVDERAEWAPGGNGGEGTEFFHCCDECARRDFDCR